MSLGLATLFWLTRTLLILGHIVDSINSYLNLHNVSRITIQKVNFESFSEEQSQGSSQPLLQLTLSNSILQL